MLVCKMLAGGFAFVAGVSGVVVVAACGCTSVEPTSPQKPAQQAVVHSAGTSHLRSPVGTRGGVDVRLFESFAARVQARWPSLDAEPKGLLAPTPSSCPTSTRTAPVVGASEMSVRGDSKDIISKLGAALARQAPAERDVALLALVGDWPLSRGVLDALRADLWSECADSITDAALAAESVGTDPGLLQALRFAGRVNRFGVALGGESERISPSAVQTYRRQVLEPWLAPRVAWLRTQSRLAGEFTEAYPRALAAWAVAQAWARLFHAPVARASGAGGDVLRDYELRTRLYSDVRDALSTTLPEARRDLLRALHAISVTGALHSEHVRPWLADGLALFDDGKLGRSPLSQLILPHLELREPPRPLDVVIEVLPPHYWARMIEAGIAEPSAMGALELESVVMSGFAPELRRAITDHITSLPVTARVALSENEQRWVWALARHYLRAGLMSHESAQFEFAAHWFSLLSATEPSAWLEAHLPSLHFQRLLVDALAKGPRNAAEWGTGTASLPLQELTVWASREDVASGVRAFAAADAAVLSSVGPLDVQGVKQLSHLVRQSTSLDDGRPFSSCIAEIGRSLSDTWSGPIEGPAARCEQYRETLRRAGTSLRSPTVVKRALDMRMAPCPAWAWSEQRVVVTGPACPP